MKPRLSVVIPCYNMGHFVEATLDSIFAQDFQDFECIVVDGGSTDDTLQILKKYPRVKVVSEKDRGYYDAAYKAIKLAQGEYVAHCCISDGYLDPQWFSKCINAMEADKEVSLVWGLAQYMSEDGKPLAVSFPQFHNHPAPQKEEFFYYWLAGYFWFPEVNFCIRRRVLWECFPPFNDENLKNVEAWLGFNFNFEKEGYLALYLPVIANYGRIHAGQAGEIERVTGNGQRKYQLHLKEWRAYRRKLLSGQVGHVYRDGDGNPLPYGFSRWHFISSQFLSPRRAADHAGRFFINKARTTIAFLESRNLMPQFLRDLVTAKRRAKTGLDTLDTDEQWS